MSASVAVIAGGWSSERDVSLMGSGNIAAALRDAGYDVREIDVKRDIPALVEALTPPPDIVYNALHGPYGEDGCIQGILECLGVRYTHSGVLASALAMDKPMAKHLFRSAGIPCPEHRIVTRAEFDAGERIDLPFVVKPLNEGSSVGVRIVRTEADVAALDDAIWAYGSRMMLESFIDGREITVSVMGDKALGVTEIRALEGFYDYEAKYEDDATRYEFVDDLASEIRDRLTEAGLAACRALATTEFARVDLIVDVSGQPTALEVNTIPGMTDHSLVPKAAARIGLSMSDLCNLIVARTLAAQRSGVRKAS